MNVVSIQNLNVYYAQHQALKNVNLEVEEGAFLGILGPNGGGKSTLIKAVAGSIPYSGTIKIFGAPRNFSCLGYMPQSSDLNRKFPINVLEVCMSAYLRKKRHFFIVIRKLCMKRRWNVFVCWALSIWRNGPSRS